MAELMTRHAWHRRAEFPNRCAACRDELRRDGAWRRFHGLIVDDGFTPTVALTILRLERGIGALATVEERLRSLVLAIGPDAYSVPAQPAGQEGDRDG